ncbi:radical SAM family heme chaperone HemW [Marinimicrobium agarilyticum]|uniref:radical SAM family heme chaperone HemW n=1 Tax=Marinimicrobium agarilyticum TaxID=306546 RepID=UPI0004183313|nr:radical SAM family heme chaperone HemW [Marinimicrobium agarilyticum]
MSAALPSLTLPPLSLYVHIPWCVRKCPYCDFNSHQAGENLPEHEYVDALIEDLKAEAPMAQGRRIHTVFFGGGTPSLFSADAIGRILENVDRLVGLSTDAEITLEANPGTFEQARFSGYRHAGVNRLSIGIQSFQEAQLQRLGRIHGREEALAAVEVARKAGFDNLNLDLMHGLPDQTTAAARADLAQAIALAPEHLSWYQLTIEPNTHFYNAPPLLPVEDTLADIQDTGEALLAAAGYQQYEVSAYARPQRRAGHNLNYWTYGDYLGVGAGAHGKITLPESGRIVRRWKTRLPAHYLERRHGGSTGPMLAGEQTLEPEALPLDYLLNALRLNEGVPSAQFTERTGLLLQALQPAWQGLEEKGLVHPYRERLVTTDLGRRFLNDVLAAF